MAVFDYGSARRLYLRILDPIVKDGYHAQDRFRHCLLPIEDEPAILYEIKS